ncbi:hypothetical protein LSUE1_G004906 [Lachnellula suecica]|uniref:Uncharacterized protein n=1 Tax=Lachnellula suecica TaxID=602035 RepID=A0A8T9C892_9HELO|nr:hypothetical protein LSUE1_G004906 [Lachnellula suecica]
MPTAGLGRVDRPSPFPASDRSLSERGVDVYGRNDEQSYYLSNLKSIDPNERLIQNNGEPPPAHKKYVKWGISWKTPFAILSWALVGFALAFGHHFYYMSLHGTKVGSSSRQNWALRFGTAFSFLVIATLRASCEAAYKQHIWTLFKRKSFALDTVDKIFSATSVPWAFMSWDFVNNAKVAFFLAMVCWCMALAGITPPATLSVVQASQNATLPTSLPSLNWHLPSWFTSSQNALSYYPSSEVLRISTLAAQSMAVIPPTPPAANSSFRVQFYGPTVECNPANSSQQPSFDYYSASLGNGSSNTWMVATKSLFESGKLVWQPYNDSNIYSGVPYSGAPLMDVYSAFSPYAGQLGWLSRGFANNLSDFKPISGDSPGLPNYSSDKFNNWGVDLPADFPIQTGSNWSNPNFNLGSDPQDPRTWIPFITQQLWIQTADQGMVCVMGNSSFDVAYEFVNGVQTVAETTISGFEPFWMPISSYLMTFMVPANETSPLPLDHWNSVNSYMAVFQALSSLLSGNVSTSLTNSYSSVSMSDADNYIFDGNVTIYDDSSMILQHGLSACDEFVHGYWNGDNAIGIGETGPVPWREATTAIHIGDNATTGNTLGPGRFTNISNNLFTKPAWMCRNRTLLRAVEDLANNITISMLSSANLVSQNATTVDVLYFPTANIYKYDSRNLIISYSIAALFTIAGMCIGFFALQYNGVAHSAAFSAIVATTRNHDLNAVSRGHSLGALPLEHETLRVRFGELVKGGGGGHAEDEWDDGRGDVRHIGFGAAENVLSLRKGGKYV